MTDANGEGVRSIPPETLLERLEVGNPVTVLDVRDRDEVESWRIDHPDLTFRHVPYAKFLSAKVTDSVDDLLDFDIEGQLLVVCPRGEASNEVAGILREVGYEADNLAGGMQEWARLYRRRQVAGGVYQYQRPATGCLAYLVVDGEEAAVVDPLDAFTDRYLDDAADLGVELVYAVDTHVHADHLSGLRTLKSAGVEPVVPAESVERGLRRDVSTIEPGDAILVGDRELTAVALPGHTTDMTGFTLDGVLLTGDSVFLDGVARPDLQEEGVDAESLTRELFRTLQDRLGGFRDSTRVLPGHYADADERNPNGTFVATLGELRDRVPAFDWSEAELVARLTGDQPPQPANFERIVDVNLGRESVDEETALELELGPNNCAAAVD